MADLMSCPLPLKSGQSSFVTDETELPCCSETARQSIRFPWSAWRHLDLGADAKCDDDLPWMVFEAAPGGMLVTDLSGTINRVNHAFADTLGYTAAELNGR